MGFNHTRKLGKKIKSRIGITERSKKRDENNSKKEGEHL